MILKKSLTPKTSNINLLPMKSPQVELKRKIPVVYMYCGSNINETKKKAKKLNIEYFVEKPI